MTSDLSLGETQAIISVLEFPPRLSCSSLVNLLSLWCRVSGGEQELEQEQEQEQEQQNPFLAPVASPAPCHSAVRCHL